MLEPTAFSSGWCSHKFKGAGLCYEIAISIKGGDICWTNGPFPAGKYADLTIFRRGLKKKLDPGEYVEADHGYSGEPATIRLPFQAENKEEIARKGRARARHEGFNGYIKNFGAMSKRWRHPIVDGQHKCAFDAVVSITQLAKEIGEFQPFECSAPYWM